MCVILVEKVRESSVVQEKIIKVAMETRLDSTLSYFQNTDALGNLILSAACLLVKMRDPVSSFTDFSYHLLHLYTPFLMENTGLILAVI